MATKLQVLSLGLQMRCFLETDSHRSYSVNLGIHRWTTRAAEAATLGDLRNSVHRPERRWLDLAKPTCCEHRLSPDRSQVLIVGGNVGGNPSNECSFPHLPALQIDVPNHHSPSHRFPSTTAERAFQVAAHPL